MKLKRKYDCKEKYPLEYNTSQNNKDMYIKAYEKLLHHLLLWKIVFSYTITFYIMSKRKIYFISFYFILFTKILLYYNGK